MNCSVTWAMAVSNCLALAYGGHTDWRLPTVQELQSLIDYRQSSPALCNTAGTGKWAENDPFTGVQSDYYWSSSEFAVNTDYAWIVFLYYGYVNDGIKPYTFYAWPVRGGR